MLVIIGYIVIVFCVFGGYALSGGNLHALFQPYELIIIGGAALGSFIIANSTKVIKSSITSAFSTLKGAEYSRKFYIELLSLFFELTNKIKKDGILSIEQDIEDYKKSQLLSHYKLILREHKIMEFMCDHLRLIVTGRVDKNHLEQLMDEDIETFEHEAELPINAITKVADSLPAFGIVAAVMGVVTTMGMIEGSPAVLGHHVAAALVGTFLGVLLGYGFVAPIASILQTRLQSELIIMQSVKVVLIASVHNMAPIIAVEFARKVLYSSERPTNSEMEVILKEVRARKGKTGEAK
jgi:chemotaxis protein MotA